MDNNENKSKFFDMNPATPVDTYTPKVEETKEEVKPVVTNEQETHPVFDLMASNDAVKAELDKKKQEEDKKKKTSARTALISIVVLAVAGLFIYNVNNIFPNKTLLQSISVNSVSCANNSCSMNITTVERESGVYYFNKSKFPVLALMEKYNNFVVLDIYYNDNWGTKSIMDYKIYAAINNEDITNVSNEDELRTKLGLYIEGKSTDTFKLYSRGSKKTEYILGQEITYRDCIILNHNGLGYGMRIIENDKTKDMEEGKEYLITFEVTKVEDEYQMNVIDIQLK